ncbi:hypothetical protein Sango_0366400 [Sesamum angolense]|uniref:Uncharacterized protein n=1 Tax=Sesamum angolense TaxID=2727404 RepID=A0AAE2C3M5_9LAMI|nr:hypothetical protein Sango_0366400 [Sesamum angolense]
MQEKQYPFLNSDVLGIFDYLVDANLIELSEMKQSKEAGQIDDPKYCKYHRLIGYSIQDFFVFKDKVMQLARQGKISLEEDSATTNLMSTKYGYSDDEYLLLGSKPHNLPLFMVGIRRQLTLAISCGKVLKVKTMIFTQTQYNEDNRKSVASSNYINSSDSNPDESANTIAHVCEQIITTPQVGTKFTSRWDEPFVVKEAYTNGAYKLVAEDGLRIGPINRKFLK